MTNQTISPYFSLGLLGMCLTSAMLFGILMISMFGDPTLSALQGIKWAVGTPEHRMIFALILVVLCPSFGMMTGLGAGRMMYRNSPRPDDARSG